MTNEERKALSDYIERVMDARIETRTVSVGEVGQDDDGAVIATIWRREGEWSADWQESRKIRITFEEVK